MARILDESSVGRELKTGAGPAKRERSLSADVAYDVQRVLYRKWIIVVIEYLLKLLAVVFFGWLAWRGFMSLLPTSAPAVPAAPVPVPAPEPAEVSAVGAPWILWLALAVLLLPVVTISFIRTMVSKRSNGVNAFTLGVYTAIDAIIAYFMVGMSLETTASVVLFAGVVLFSLFYNVAVMNFAVRLEDGR